MNLKWALAHADRIDPLTAWRLDVEKGEGRTRPQSMPRSTARASGESAGPSSAREGVLARRVLAAVADERSRVLGDWPG